mmetsp:Transcript_759/g.1756  ORF Transcript_759/g.1756 Transcript_759/m.1756 type:complete len:289 (-) Transcript_759:358-1224(-)|eukprot:CAMPEP_0197606884 /NCGR_PEP_ID=MMETSP1326-20131121/45969_1 /TAXON_ID=1155430 /ORGANISM="Genus nov. species nov., Strain RCC2288" /LENGTH=288 /DNA_ID=CAMNT_0043174875 /DNA_START=233 /DNA_END=1099 /DNA_ORIENTATION=+
MAGFAVTIGVVAPHGGAAVGVRPRQAKGGAAQKAAQPAYNMSSFSGLKAAPSEFAKRSVSLGDTVRAAVGAASPSGKGSRRVTTMMPIGVPRVPYKTPNENSWQWVDIWNCLYRERIIWVGSTIDEEMGNQLVATMLYLDTVDKAGKDIFLYINNDGGEIVPTMAIMDTMKHIKADVGCVAFGSARAMGGMLLACGAKGKRAALPNTCIMLHHPNGVARGQASDIANEGRELLKIRVKINQMLAAATGQPEEKINKDIRRDMHLTAEGAVDYGVIDKVIYKRRGGTSR